MNGRLWCESEIGIGSQFHFTIPIVHPPSPHPPEDQNALPQLAGKTVLVVDEHSIVKDFLSIELDRCGINVVMTSTVDEALSLCAEEHNFSLAIVDDMPDIGRVVDTMGSSRSIFMIYQGVSSPIMTSQYLRKPLRLKNLLFAMRPPGDREENFPRSPMYMRLLNAHTPSTPPLINERHHVPRLRVLVVEDNQVNRLLARRMIEGIGHVVGEAVDGIDGVEAVARTQYDIVLMDLHMPRLGGLEASKQISSLSFEHPRFKPVIIALTADVTAETRAQSHSCGIDDFLSKPTKKLDLENMLSVWSSRSIAHSFK